MSGFSAGWLALREPLDSAARAEADAIAAFACTAVRRPCDVVDLACGTGANLRALAPRLGHGQRWRLVDHDAALLAAVPAALERWAVQCDANVSLDGDEPDAPVVISGPAFDATVFRQRLDLARDLDALPLPTGALLTASALLDLVSADWLGRLLDRAAAARCPLLFSLSVDGRIAWDPADADDAAVHAAFAAHQRRDKGFGPALGGEAVAWADKRLAAAGWQTCSAPSDWRIDGASSAALLQALIDGSADAAIEQTPTSRAAFDAWRQRRQAQRAATRLQLGHLDLAARPPMA